MAKSLRTLTLKSLGSAWDQDPFWLQLATLTNLISLEIEFASPSPLEPLEFAPQPRRNASIPCQPLPDLHVAKVRGMSNTTWRALGVVRNAAHVLLMQCRVGAGDVEGLLPNAEWLDGGGTSSQTTPTKPRVLVNSRVKTLVVQLLVDYAPVMWRHLAHCPALQRLSIQCPSTMNTSNMQVCVFVLCVLPLTQLAWRNHQSPGYTGGADGLEQSAPTGAHQFPQHGPALPPQHAVPRIHPPSPLTIQLQPAHAAVDRALYLTACAALHVHGRTRCAATQGAPGGRAIRGVWAAGRGACIPAAQP